MNKPTESPEELQAIYDDMKRVFSNSLQEIWRGSPDHYEEVKKNFQEILEDFRKQYPSVK